MNIPGKGLLQFLPDKNKLVERLHQPSARGSWAQETITGNSSTDLTRHDDAFSKAGQDKQMPDDSREDRVMQLKRKLEAGTYRVKGNRIAVHMINEALENNQVIKHIDSKV